MNHWDIKNITLFDKRYNDGGAASRYQQLDFDRGTDIHSSNVAVTRRVTGARPSRRSQMETPTTLRMRWPDLKPGSGAAAISAGTTTTRQKGSPLLRANNTTSAAAQSFWTNIFQRDPQVVTHFMILRGSHHLKQDCNSGAERRETQKMNGS